MNSFLQITNEILHKGVVPSSWRKTLFQMLPKTHRARVPADFRPIANLRILYKVFAYLVLGRIEATLEQHQPEEQHGFRSGRRIEEHLLTANTKPAKPTPDSSRTSPHLTTSKLRGCSSCSVPAHAATTYCGCFRPLLPPNMPKTTTLQWHTASPPCLTPDRSPQQLLPLHTSH